MKQTKNANAKATAPSKVQSANLAVTTKKAHANQKAEETATERETKYHYPDTCKTPDQKKEFRRKARQSMRKYEKELAALRASNEKADRKLLKERETEFTGWKAETYNN